MKGQKNEILTRQESRHSSRPDVFYFLPTAHPPTGGQLVIHIANIAKALQSKAENKALSKIAILPTLQKPFRNIVFVLNKTLAIIQIC